MIASSGSSSGTFVGSASEEISFIISSCTASAGVSSSSFVKSLSASFFFPVKISRMPLDIFSWRLSAPFTSRSSISTLSITGASSSDTAADSVFSSDGDSALSSSDSSTVLSFGINCLSYFSFSLPVSIPIRLFRSSAFMTYLPSLNQRTISSQRSRHFLVSPF